MSEWRLGTGVWVGGKYILALLILRFIEGGCPPPPPLPVSSYAYDTPITCALKKDYCIGVSEIIIVILSEMFSITVIMGGIIKIQVLQVIKCT